MIGGLAYLNESESGDRKLTDHAKERASAANRS